METRRSRERPLLEALHPELPPLLPGLPRPVYRFTPGFTLHPDRSPSHQRLAGLPALTAPEIPETVREHLRLLAGIDLYHDGYLWESHEMWEAPWMAAKAVGDSKRADFFRALIYNSAGVLKQRLGQRKGALRHGMRAVQTLEALISAFGQHYLGMQLTPTLRGIEAFYRRLEPDRIAREPDPFDLPAPKLYHDLQG